MQKLFAYSLLIFLMLNSCGKERDCVQEDFLGSYTGTRSCETVTPEDYSTTFTAGSNSDEIVWMYNGTTYTLTIDGCTAKYDNTVLGQGFKVQFSKNEDGTISGFYKTTALVSVQCDIELSK